MVFSNVGTFPWLSKVTIKATPTNGGTVTRGGEFGVCLRTNISAFAQNGWRFSSWTDGNTQNSRIITVTTNASVFIAKFIKSN